MHAVAEVDEDGIRGRSGGESLDTWVKVDIHCSTVVRSNLSSSSSQRTTAQS